MTAATTMDLEDLRVRTSGRWGEIFSTLGIHVPANPKEHSPCPACGGKDRFRFDDREGRGTWFCNQCDPHAGDGFALVQKVRRVGFGEAVALVREGLGLSPKSKGARARRIMATYDYKDEAGTLLYQTVRYDPKDFKQRRPDGHSGWIWKLDGVRFVLYHLPDVLAAERVLILEGEKDVDTAYRLGLPDGWAATCNAMGAKKWRPEYSDSVAAKACTILPDADATGQEHGDQVGLSLHSKARSVSRLTLPHGKDLSDWAERGGSAEAFRELLDAAKPWGEAKPLGLPLTRLGDLLNEPEVAVDWIVKDRLPAAGFSLLAGKPKAGKSTLARCLALAVSRGTDFLGQPTEQGPVFYLALEEKRSEVRKHFKAMGATKDEPIFIFASPSPQDGLHQLRLAAEREKPVLIIVDPLFKFVRPRDGNDYAAMSAALEPLLTLARETGAHVLAVHHLGKGEREGGDAILGSTAIFAAVDTALIMKRTDKYRTLSSVQRYGEDLEEITLTFDPASRTITAGPSRQEADTQEAARAIKKFLKAQTEAAEEKTILEAVEGRRGLKVKVLRWLVETQAVIRAGKGGKADPYRYSVSTQESCSSVPGNSREHGNKNQQEPSGQGVSSVKAGSPDSCSLVPSIGPEQENKNPSNAQTPCQDRQDSCSQDSGLFGSCSQGRQGTREQESDLSEEVLDDVG